MTGNEYQMLAMRTIRPEFLNNLKENLDNAEVDQNMIEHAVFGLCAEAGEVASIFQKFHQGHKVTKEHVIKELGDCLWFIAETATSMGIGLDTIMQTNIDKLIERYPDGFDEERSLHRVKGDI